MRFLISFAILLLRQGVAKLAAQIVAALFLTVQHGNAQEQRSFPTGDNGSGVTYLDAYGTGHPTGCIIVLTSGLPTLSLSINIFDNNRVTMTVASQNKFIYPAVGSAVGFRVNSTYIFGKVLRDASNATFNAFDAEVVGGNAGNGTWDSVYKAINWIVYGQTLISVVADDANVATATIPAQPGVGDALAACQRYQVSRH